MPAKLVICVMVSFNCKLKDLKRSIDSVIHNNVQLVLVDNGSNNQLEVAKLVSYFKQIELIALEKNMGIATAQNKGIELAIKNNANYIWLSDQDTIYPNNFKQRMLSLLAAMDYHQLQNLAVLGPSLFDNTLKSVYPIFKFQPYTMKSSPKPGLNASTHIIASGMFIPSKIFKKVGLKRDDLFIDWVDTEWCWRAVYQYGLDVWVTGDIQIDHSLGDEYESFFRKKVTLRTPFRHYFMIRNAIFLAIYSKNLPLIPRVEIVLKTTIRTILFPLIVPTKKMQHLKATTLGFYHGLIGRLGSK